MQIKPLSPALSITVFGIPNCDTVKKSRVWLQENNLAFRFHDFKKQGLDRATVMQWLEFTSLDLLINRKGTTWRALSDEQKASVSDPEQAISLILASPSLIKRPVLQINVTELTEPNQQNLLITAQQIHLGFKPDQYQTIFSSIS